MFDPCYACEGKGYLLRSRDADDWVECAICEGGGTTMTTLDQVRAYAKSERAEGRPLHFDVAFVISRPTLTQIRDWYPDCPAKTKAEAINWLARRARATTGKQE